MGSKKNMNILTVVGVTMFFLLFSITATTSMAKPIRLVYTEHDPANSLWVQNIIEPWITELEKKSNGGIVVERHYGGELFGIFDAYDAAIKGVVDIAYFFPCMLPGRFELHNINTLTSSDKVNWRPGTTYWELIQQFPEMQDSFKGTVLLAVGQFFQPFLASCTKPIHSFADFKGMRWLTTSEYGGKRLAAWGAVPSSVPPEDLFSSFQKGIVEGSAMMLDTLWGMNLGQVYKYATQVCNDPVNLAMAMNKKKFDKLPDDLQKLIKEMGLKLTRSIDEYQIGTYHEMKQKAIEDFGLEFIMLPQEELDKFEAAGAPIRDELAAALDAKGLPGTKVKEAFLAIEDKYSKPEYAPKGGL